jgi:hypothetical protein
VVGWLVLFLIGCFVAIAGDGSSGWLLFVLVHCGKDECTVAIASK